jgi:hypothetical protein
LLQKLGDSKRIMQFKLRLKTTNRQRIEMRMKALKMASLAALLLASSYSNAAISSQWANGVTGFSSEWNPGAWGTQQAVGAPDTFSYGDIPTAWAPSPMNGSQEFISLSFANAVYSVGALIRETYGNGFVTRIDAIDMNNQAFAVWSGTDTSQAGSPVDFMPTWSQTSFLTKGLKIYVNTNHDLGAWEEIDAVALQSVAPVPEPETYALMGLGLLGLLATRRKKR